MIKLKEREFIYIKMELHIQDNGKMTNSMDLDKKNGLMGHFIRETLSKD